MTTMSALPAGTQAPEFSLHATPDRRLGFPLLADFEPKGDVSRRYGAYREKDGFSERALFVIDAEGIVRWSYLSPVGVNPGADGIFEALESLTPEQRGHAVPSGAKDKDKDKNS